MKFLKLLFVILLSAAVAYTTSTYVVSHSNGATPAGAETAFDRITKTNTLRCGYAVATPWFMIDSKTQQPAGVGYDITNAIAAKTGLKVEWVEETGWGVAEQGLMAGRYDMLCGSVCVDPRRARAATYSTPYLHLPIVAVVRDGETRFDNLPDPLKAMNDKNVKMGVKNGHVFEFIANEQFPQAEKVYGNDISDDTEFFEMLNTHKIDVAFSGQVTVDLYNEKNPNNKVKSVAAVRFCDGGFMMPLGDYRLKYMIDNAIMELNTSGQIRAILNKWVKPDDPLYARAPALPYGK